MAIENCRECDREVSSKAKTCPYCGISKPVHTTSPIMVIFLSMITVLVVMCMMSKNEPRSSATKKLSIKERVELTCRKGVRGVVKNLGGSIHKWGHQRSWEKNRVVFFSQRFAVKSDLGPISYMKITCSADRQTETFNIVSVVDV